MIWPIFCLVNNFFLTPIPPTPPPSKGAGSECQKSYLTNYLAILDHFPPKKIGPKKNPPTHHQLPNCSCYKLNDFNHSASKISAISFSELCTNLFPTQEEQLYRLHEETEFTEEEFQQYKNEKVRLHLANSLHSNLRSGKSGRWSQTACSQKTTITMTFRFWPVRGNHQRSPRI